MALSQYTLNLIRAAKSEAANKEIEVSKMERAGNMDCAESIEREIAIIRTSVFLLESRCATISPVQLTNLVSIVSANVDPAALTCSTNTGFTGWTIGSNPNGCNVFTVGGIAATSPGEFTAPEFVNQEFTIGA